MLRARPLLSLRCRSLAPTRLLTTSSNNSSSSSSSNNNNKEGGGGGSSTSNPRWDGSGRWERGAAAAADAPTATAPMAAVTTTATATAPPVEATQFMMPEQYGEYFRVPNPALVLTKCVATLGPATASREMIDRLLGAGMAAARLNVAHGTYQDFDRLVDDVRLAASRRGVICPIIIDVKGPEIRVGKVMGGAITLEQHRPVEIVYGAPPAPFTAESVPQECTPARIFINYARIGDSVKEGDVVLLDNGRIALSVRKILSEKAITCRVISGGVLKSNKGVNLPGCVVHLPHVTEKDKRDIAYAVSRNIEYIAHSFTRSGEGIREVRNLPGVREAGTHIIAKVESQEGLDNFDAILDEADGIMVARGDLGVEIPLERVCSVQKRIIRECNARGKFVITATEMLESMIQNMRPTRAEASDVANACYDGTDCVMLSGETAVGAHPVESVQVMTRICKEAEQDAAELSFAEAETTRRRLLGIQQQTNAAVMLGKGKSVVAPLWGGEGVGATTDQLREAFSQAAVDTAHAVNASVILCLTKSGSTARVLAKFRPRVPVLALAVSPKVCAQVSLYHSVKPVLVTSLNSRSEYLPVALSKARAFGLVKKGSRVVLLYGVDDTQKTLETYLVGDHDFTATLLNSLRYQPGSSLVMP